MTIKTYIHTNPGKSVIIFFIFISIGLAIACIIAPELVWDKFIWRYFWGPLEADAQDRTIDGISEGYNIISTITYGIILAAALFVIYRLVVVLGIDLDKWFFLAVIPFILFGSFARALEDALLFRGRAIYIFISPTIYVFTGLVTIGAMVIAHKICETRTVTVRKRIRKKSLLSVRQFAVGYLLAGSGIIVLMAVLFFETRFTNWFYVITTLATALVILFLTLLIIVKRPELRLSAPVFGSFGSMMFAFPAAAVGFWFLKPDQWIDAYLTANALESVELMPEVIPLVIGLALAATAVWAVTALKLTRKKRFAAAAVFGSGVNLVLVFGQFTDASATFIAIDYYNYWEKHVLPSFLITVLDTAAVMFVLKVIALVFAIYALDIYLRDELKRYRQIVPLIKIAILVLGLAPGVRDMLRLGMGV